MNTDTDIDLFELVLFDVIIALLFVCFSITAVFFTGQNLFLILLTLAFGALTFPYAGIFGEWMLQIKSREREKLGIHGITIKDPLKWIFLDFGKNGNAWVFRLISVMTAGFALYNLIRYFTG
jgi:hypothetical protein